MFTCDRCNLRPGHQALRGDLRLLRCRAIATPSRPLNHLKPTDAARLRDVQLDVHFAVCNHTTTSLIRGQLCTLSCHAPHQGMSEALTNIGILREAGAATADICRTGPRTVSLRRGPPCLVGLTDV